MFPIAYVKSWQKDLCLLKHIVGKREAFTAFTPLQVEISNN